MEIKQAKIKLVMFDFDGVFTDGKIYVTRDGDEMKCYNGKDSYGLKLLSKKGIKTGIITADCPDILRNCRHIMPRVDIIEFGHYEKLNVLSNWIEHFGLEWEEVAYMGDDLPDIPCLKKVGFSGCPSDAVKEVLDVCNFVTTKEGGNGAVREFVDEIISHRI